jgi:hypothetical protein
MRPIPINIAVEDLLSEAIAQKLLHDANRGFAVGTVFNRGGNGYLRRTATGWNNAAKGIPFLLLTDLDATPCATELVETWISEPVHPNFIFRVAVREVEAWLLADRINFAQFLKISPSLITLNPDDVQNPKETLIALTRRSPLSQKRARIVPKENSTAKQGRDYNSCLIEFVNLQWDSSQAALNSKSLARCKHHLSRFRPTWEK